MNSNSIDISNNSLNTADFSKLVLIQPLLDNLVSLGYSSMTPIQAKSLPSLLSGQDVIAKANTGSGKTAAFGLTILNNINLKFFAVQALVLCPTRELAEQVSQSIRQLARLMPNVKIINISGGMPMRAQQDSLQHGAHIVVGTPGRVIKHLLKETLKLDKLTMLVLDEADKMLDMGFLEDMQSIRKRCPSKRQTLLFSATFQSEIKALSYEFMRNPEEIFIENTQTEQNIEQVFYEVEKNNKFEALIALLKNHQSNSTLIFCNTKQSTADVANMLDNAGFSVIALHGDMEQPERDLSIIRFANQSVSILVATDVAARGLDIKDLPLVINYELAFEPEVHTHRIGRTGRAGIKGVAITLSTVSDARRIVALEDTNSSKIVFSNIADLKVNNDFKPTTSMVTFCLDSGKKNKIRARDILGALIKDASIPKDAVGKINILPFKSYVAIHKDHAKAVDQFFKNGKLKGRYVNIARIN